MARGVFKAVFSFYSSPRAQIQLQIRPNRSTPTVGKAFAARAVGESGFAGPGGVRGPPRATATAKTAYTWLARPAMAKAAFNLSLLCEGTSRLPGHQRCMSREYSNSKRFAFSIAFRK